MGRLLISESVTDPWAQKLMRVCAANRVTLGWEIEIDRIEIPLPGSSRVAYRRGRERILLHVAQGPIGGLGAVPLPAMEFGSLALRGDPYANARPRAMFANAQRTSFGGVEFVVVVDDEETLREVLRRVYWCLMRDGTLRHLRLPNGTDNVLMLTDVDPAGPWRGYARFAA